MIDIKAIIASGEHSKLEVKQAAKGVPDSLWETYSAFANTEGGIILLGVAEADNTLHITGVTDAPKKIKNIWDQLNDRKRTSVNVLFDRNIYVQRVENKDIIVIEVPRSDRRDKPVYINNDLTRGTYRRNAEGDYHCSLPEIKAMLRDQSDIASDSRVIEELSFADLDPDSISGYRNHFAALKPAHVWNRLGIDSFLHKTGALGRSESGSLKPTLAGLVMFGTEDVITQILPDYFLDYREINDSRRWSDRIVSNLGEWSGNIFDFFFKVVNKLTADIKIPFRLRNEIERASDTPIHAALREALANCVIHADYYGRQGIVIEKRPEKISFANPGIFRPNMNEVFDGGISDPRNPSIFKMFALIDIGERAGSGLFNIRTIWQDQGWQKPVWEEKFSPERLVLSVPIEGFEKGTVNPKKRTVNFEKGTVIFEQGSIIAEQEIVMSKRGTVNPEKGTVNPERGTVNSEKGTVNPKKGTVNLEKGTVNLTENQRSILNGITQNPAITTKKLSEVVGISLSKIKENISKLKRNGLLERIGSDKNGYWQITGK